VLSSLATLSALPRHLARRQAWQSALTVPLSSLRAARALRRSPVPSPGQVSPGLLPEALELRQEAVSMVHLLRFPSLEHGRRQVALAGAGTRREGSQRNAPLRPCKEYQRPGLGCCGLARADGAGLGHQVSSDGDYSTFYIEDGVGFIFGLTPRNRVQACYKMLLRPLAEAKNTIEHNIAAQERAHSVHMKITLFVSAPWPKAYSYAP